MLIIESIPQSYEVDNIKKIFDSIDVEKAHFDI